MAGLISRRPWILIAAWLVLVVVSFPLASKINDVVVTSETGFLPESAESIRAMKALESLYGQASSVSGVAGSPDYLIVVHGVPVSLDTYWRLKEPYMALKSESVNMTSWIDILAGAEASIRSGMVEAVNASLPLFEGIIGLNKGYLNALKAVNRTILLVNSTDVLYSNLYRSSQALAGSVDKLDAAGKAIIDSCTTLGPLYSATYYNVVRVEVLLEEVTNAYEEHVLGEDDIARVLNASINLTDKGVPPVTPELIYGVYMSVVRIGGPSEFNNTVGSLIAFNLLNESLREDAKPLLAAVSRAWSDTVSTDIDHRLFARMGGIVEGQLNLLSRVNQMYIESRPLIVKYTAEAFKELMPDNAKPLIDLLAAGIIDAECNVNLEEVLREAIATLYASQGVDAEIASILSNHIISGAISNRVVANLTVSYIKESYKSEELEKLGRQLVEVLVTMDPRGNMTLKSPDRALKAVAMVMGVDPSIADTPEDLAYTLVEREIRESGGQGLELLEYLNAKGVLGLEPGELLEIAPDIVAEFMSLKSNKSVDELEPIVREAYKVYLGRSSLEDAVNALTSRAMGEVFSNITDSIRGLIIEKDLEGFIVTLTPAGGDAGDNLDIASRVREELVDILYRAGYYNSETYLAGNVVMSHEVREAAQRDIEKTDRLSIVFVILILGIVLESVAAVLLPFIGIGFGLIVSLAAAYILANAGVIDVTTQSRTIMFTTGLGLGIDYAAYISKRFREALARLPPREAAEEAFRRSWRPVLAGALTASIGFGSMMLAKDFPFIYSIGSNVPLTILAVMLASITFIPALLAYIGGKRWFWWPSSVEYKMRDSRVMARVGGSILKSPLVPIAVVILLSLFASYQYVSFEGSYDLSLNLPRDSEVRKALDIINSYYDPGSLYPVYIVASSPSTANNILEGLQGVECIASSSIAEGFQGRVVRVVLAVDPNSQLGVECVSQIRDVSHSIDPESLVGGMPAVNLDFRNLLNSIFYGRVYPVALFLMFLTLLLAYGGIAVALGGVAGVVLAAVWSTAFTTYIYQDIAGIDVLWFLPVIVFTAILGVGMDYNSFFIARAREECEAECSRRGVLNGMIHGSPIVLGLSTIMAGAYVGLALASSPGLSEMGVALTLGVLLAGINASLIITPPLIAILGRWAWWPSRLKGER